MQLMQQVFDLRMQSLIGFISFGGYIFTLELNWNEYIRYHTEVSRCSLRDYFMVAL